MPVSVHRFKLAAETWVLIAAILGSSMAFIDGTVVNIALPALQSSLHASGTELQWVVEAYALFLAALLLVCGSMSDVFGRRLIFILGTIVFAAASAACGLSATIYQLIAARAVQGVGAALLVPGSLALISSTYPESTRGAAIGTWSGFTAITAAIGPLMGGWLVQHAGWRWVFFLNLPLAAAVLLIIFMRVRPAANDVLSANSGRSLDIAGASTATAGLAAVTFALIEFTRLGRLAIVPGLGGMLLLIAFVWIEVHAPKPMVPLALFRSRNFTGANLMTFFLYAALGGLLYYLPLNLIQIQGYTAVAAGAALLPLILLIFLLSRWSGSLVVRFGERIPLVAGPLIAAAGFALFIRVGLGNGYWSHVFPAVLALGLGLAISVAPLTTVVMNAVEQESAGSASGINNATSRVASLLAVALFGVLFSHAFTASLASHLAHGCVSQPDRQQILAQAASLGATTTTTSAGHLAVQSAFVASFNKVALSAAALSICAALLAATIIQKSVNQKPPIGA